MKSRELRRPVVIAARIRWSGTWMSGTVRNVSSGGLMMAVDPPPPRGSYVEVRIGAASLIGVSVWSDEARCGLQTRGRIDPDALLSARAATADANFPEVERRAVSRPGTVDPAGRSRMIGSLIQFAMLATLASAAAGGLGWGIYQGLAGPMRIIEAQL